MEGRGYGSKAHQQQQPGRQRQGEDQGYRPDQRGGYAGRGERNGGSRGGGRGRGDAFREGASRREGPRIPAPPRYGARPGQDAGAAPHVLKPLGLARRQPAEAGTAQQPAAASGPAQPQQHQAPVAWKKADRPTTAGNGAAEPAAPAKGTTGGGRVSWAALLQPQDRQAQQPRHGEGAGQAAAPAAQAAAAAAAAQQQQQQQQQAPTQPAPPTQQLAPLAAPQDVAPAAAAHVRPQADAKAHSQTAAEPAGAAPLADLPAGGATAPQQSAAADKPAPAAPKLSWAKRLQAQQAPAAPGEAAAAGDSRQAAEQQAAKHGQQAAGTVALQPEADAASTAPANTDPQAQAQQPQQASAQQADVEQAATQPTPDQQAAAAAVASAPAAQPSPSPELPPHGPPLPLPPGGMPVPVAAPPPLPGGVPPYFMPPGHLRPPLMAPTEPGFLPHPAMPPHPLPPPVPPMDLGMGPPPAVPPHPGMMAHPVLPHPGMTAPPHLPAWGRGVPVQPLPPLGPPMPHHPAPPSLPVHPGALPPGAPVWGPPAAAPVQQQPQQSGVRPSWGRGAPVPGPAGLAPGAPGAFRPPPASSLGSPLNPHSAVFTPSGRASPVPSATAATGELAAQPEQLAPSEMPHAADGSEQPTTQQQAQPPAQQPAEQQQQEGGQAGVLAGEAQAAAVQVAVGAAAAMPGGQAAQPAADQQPAQPAAQPAQEAVQQQPAGEQQQQVVAPVTVPVQPTAPAAASQGEAAASAAAAGSSELPAADAAAAPAAPKSWAALASATPAAAAVQFRPHTAPQRAPGQAASAPLQQRQQPQEHYPRGHDRDGHGGRGRGRGRGEGGRGRGGYPHYSSGRGAGDSLPHHHQQPAHRQQRSSDSLPHHHQQRSVGTVSVGSSGGGAPSSGSGTPKAARVPAAAPVDGSHGTPAPPTPVLPAGRPLPEALWPLCRGADLAAAAAGPSSLRVQPRGLLNPGNLCFMNSIMQALLGSSRFCQLLMALKAAAGELDPAASPTLAALAQLAAEFPPLAEPGTAQPAAQQEAAGGEAGDEAEKAAHPGSGSKAAAAATKAALLGGTPFHPHMLSEVVNAFRPLGGSSTPVSANVVLGPGSGKPNGGLPLAPRWEQEDAHDFLEYLVDRMHQELLVLARADTGAAASAGPQSAAAAAAAADAAKAAAEDEWLTKSGRRLTKRQQLKSDSETAVSALFRGTYVSTVTCAGHPPSETPEPFVSPTLHILSDSVKMVEDALDELTGPETISGYRPQDHLPPTEATKALRLQRLPPLLVLYLMRFDPANRHQKISKHVGFPPRLKMNSRWLAADSRDRAAEYELIATVTHHGKTIAAGHYTADVKQPGGQWMRFDDGQVFFVSQQQVLVQRPYLLFYQRVA